MMTSSDMGDAASMTISTIFLFTERLMKRGPLGRLGRDVPMKNVMEDRMTDTILPTKRVTPTNANLTMIEGRVT